MLKATLAGLMEKTELGTTEIAMAIIIQLLPKSQPEARKEA